MTLTRARSHNEPLYALNFTKRGRNVGLRKSAFINTRAKRRRMSKQVPSHIAIGIRRTRGLRLNTNFNSTKFDTDTTAHIQRGRRVPGYNPRPHYDLRSNTDPLQSPTKSGFTQPWRRRRLRLCSAKVVLSDMAGRLVPHLSKEAMKFMRKLNIPVLPAYCNWSQEESLRYLNWQIELMWAVDSIIWGDRDMTPMPDEPISSCSSSPSRSLQNTRVVEICRPESAGDNLQKARYLIRARLREGSFQIPTDWAPIQDQEPTCLGVREGTFDSWITERDGFRSDLVGTLPQQFAGKAHGNQRDQPHSQACPLSPPPPVSEICITPPSSRPSPERIGEQLQANSPTERAHTATKPGISTPKSNLDDEEGTDGTGSSQTIKGKRSSFPYPFPKTTIRFVPNLYGQRALIQDWEMIVIMKSQVFRWVYQQPGTLHSRALSKHVRLFSANQHPLNMDMNFPGACARMLSMHGSNMLAGQEAGAGYRIGRFLADVIATEAVPAHCLFRKQTFPGWQCPSTPVLLDVACVPSNAVLPWDQRAAPLLLAAQYSEGFGGHDRMAAEPLACAFHSTLLVLILYYLDTRTRTDDKLPSWMVVYGIVYTISGFSIHEHYPVYRLGVNGKPAQWGAASSVAVRFESAFDPASAARHQPLSALLRICGHAQFVLENLKKWNGYHRMIASRFIPQIA